MTRRGWYLFIALGVIWGLPYLLIRVSVRYVEPSFLVFVRTAGGSGLMAPFVVRRGFLRPLMGHWRALVLFTFVEIGVPWLCLSTAETKVSSSLSGLLVAAVPAAGALIALATGTDRVDRRRLAGLVLGVVGAAALVGFDVGRSSLGAASLFVLVIAGYALGPWVLARHLSGLPSATVILASLVICAVVYAPIAAVQLPRHSVPLDAVLSMACLSVVCTAVAFTVFFALIKEVGPMRATVITYVNPAVAVLLGVVVLDERFGWATGVGFVTVLGGSFLATRPLRPSGEAALREAAPAPSGG
ncbi:MAG TPA: EamA family transporter [Acidimicrobiales bacterium]|nr:EamA family transporter [Acidimicrobiales bacterium]